MNSLLEPGQFVTVQFIPELNPYTAGAPALLVNQAMTSATGINLLTGGILNIPNTVTTACIYFCSC